MNRVRQGEAMGNLQVMVIGAGTGGLALAHGLLASGIAVRVFERDRNLTERVQGYRLTINAQGARALQSCLPKANFAHYVAASAKVSTAVSFFDHKLRRLLFVEVPNTEQTDPHAARPISRVALRQILAEGLEETVAYGKTFQSFEKSQGGQIIARFEDGSSAEGDVLVGADGAASRVRRQLLPDAKRVETGLVMVMGKVPLDPSVRREAPSTVFTGPTLVLGPGGCSMFAGAVEYPPSHRSDYDRAEYVMWGFSAHHDSFGLASAAGDVALADPRAAVLVQMTDWSPNLRRLVERADPSSLSSFAVKSSVPVAPWPTSRVTVLGDALHNMTPFRGIGANTALRDAVLLRDTLVGVDKGKWDLLAALADYEREMIGYGFAAVRASLANMERLHARSPVSRFATKTFFRLADRSPWLRKQAIDTGG
jgi:2-polyprenyl-6-methoxyphenol hydroxylase-like FAD-dependent oxidoreductase